MAFPSAIAQEVFDSLPAMYRAADERQPGRPLLKFIHVMLAPLAELVDLVEEIDGGEDGLTSSLLDPETARAEWLPWLAQIAGVRLDPAMSEAERRSAIADASSSWRAGTRTAMEDAAKTSLTGTKWAMVFPQQTPTGPGGTLVAGTIWDVTVITRGSETPDPALTLAEIARRGAKPAGVTLHYKVYEASWTTIETEFPTWSALEAAGSWDAIQEAGL